MEKAPMNHLWNIFISTTLSMVLISSILWICRKIILEWLTAGMKYKYEKKIEELKAELKKDYDLEIAKVQAELQKQNNETHSMLLHELGIIRDKEMGGYKDKILIYRLAVDIFADLYVDLQKAFRSKTFNPEMIDKYNFGWVRCYGYLSMLATQEVIDSFDQLNDYILNILNGRSPIQPWGITRKYALNFLNSVRKDIGLTQSAVEYHGKL
jgi:hypothetical protein